MLTGAIKLFTIRGIEIRLDYSWFIIFGLVTWSLAAYQFPEQWPIVIRGALGVVTSLAFFFSVLAHELSHSFVAQSRGIEVPRITLFIFGGAAQIAEEPKSAGDEFMIAAAGPAMSVLLAILCGLAYLLLDRAGNQPFALLFQFLALINVSLTIFNLIPGFPLDGGRVLRALLWATSRDAEGSARIAAIVGQGVAILFIGGGAALAVTGFAFNGVWLAFIGWFLLRAARQTTRRQAFMAMLAGHSARDVMSADCVFIEPEVTVIELFHSHVLRGGRRCFPVLDGGRVAGVVTLDDIRRTPSEQWPVLTARSIMSPAERLAPIGPDTPLGKVMDTMAREGVDYFPVVEGGMFRGMVFKETLIELLRIKDAARKRPA